MKKPFLYQRNGVWCIGLPDESAYDGYRRKSLGTKKKSEANRLFARELSKFEAKEYVLGGEEKTNYLYINHFNEFLKNRNGNCETHKTYAGVLKLFIEYLKAKYPRIQYLHEINTRIVDGYAIWLKEEKMAPKGEPHRDVTINNHMKVLKTCFLQAKEWKVISEIPKCNDRRSVNDKKPIVELSKEEDMKKFLNVCKEIKPEYYNLYFVKSRTGLRWGEITSLVWDNVFLDEKFLVVKATDSFNPKGRNRKTGEPKERAIALDGDVIQVLKTIKKDNTYPNVFLRKGKPINRHEKSFNRWAKIIAREAGIKDWQYFNMHSFRHTYGTRYYEITKDSYAVKEALGHSSIETTLRYIKSPSIKMQEAVKEMEGFGLK